jgi:hypothetical protein
MRHQDSVHGSATGDWVFCATEGGECAFTGTMNVRYGANVSFVVKTLTDGTACTNAVFGDPAPDTAKHCAIQPPSTPPPPGDWTFCTTEGGFLRLHRHDASALRGERLVRRQDIH